MRNNLNASEMARKYSMDVPSYLHNRPHAEIRFCMDQIENSKCLTSTDIKECSFASLKTRFSIGERCNIAAKHKVRVTYDIILNDMRDNVPNNKFDRIHLISRKDVQNIEQCFGLEGVERHVDDAASVDTWVQER